MEVQWHAHESMSINGYTQTEVKATFLVRQGCEEREWKEKFTYPIGGANRALGSEEEAKQAWEQLLPLLKRAYPNDNIIEPNWGNRPVISHGSK